MKSPLNGIVLDSTGEDLFFYRHGRIVAINKLSVLKGFIDRSIELWQMIDAGKVDVGVFTNNYAE
jgi:hypothetical protein